MCPMAPHGRGDPARLPHLNPELLKDCPTHDVKDPAHEVSYFVWGGYRSLYSQATNRASQLYAFKSLSGLRRKTENTKAPKGRGASTSMLAKPA